MQDYGSAAGLCIPQHLAELLHGRVIGVLINGHHRNHEWESSLQEELHAVLKLLRGHVGVNAVQHKVLSLLRRKSGIFPQPV